MLTRHPFVKLGDPLERSPDPATAGLRRMNGDQLHPNRKAPRVKPAGIESDGKPR